MLMQRFVAARQAQARRPTVLAPLRRLLMMAALAGCALCCLGASCGQLVLAIAPGVVNDPGNRSLRRAIFSYAIDELCAQMQARSLPLQLRDSDPGIGRFFPTSCHVQVTDTGNLFVQFLGHGYAWTNVTGRMGFEAGAAVEYNHDFFMDGSTMYVYFRQVKTQSSKFQVLMTERGGSLPGPLAMLGGDVKQVSQQIGQRILGHQLARGFTVVRESDGSASFALGVLERGAQPVTPFGRGDSDWELLANQRTELHVGQRDFAGPFTLEDEDDVLWLTAMVEGAVGVDVLVVDKTLGDSWLHTYERNAGVTTPPGPLLGSDVLTVTIGAPGRQPAPQRRALRLRPGQYYIVFDHTTTAGRTSPPTTSLDDRAALVSYAVQLGDHP